MNWRIVVTPFHKKKQNSIKKHVILIVTRLCFYVVLFLSKSIKFVLTLGFKGNMMTSLHVTYLERRQYLIP